MLVQNLSSTQYFHTNDGFDIVSMSQTLNEAFPLTREKRSRDGSSVPMILIPSQSDKECIPSNQVKNIMKLGSFVNIII